MTYTRWVSEHLPEAKTVAESRFDGDKWWDMIWAGSNARVIATVLAWQPLPAPYDPAAVSTAEGPG